MDKESLKIVIYVWTFLADICEICLYRYYGHFWHFHNKEIICLIHLLSSVISKGISEILTSIYSSDMITKLILL